MSEEKIILGSLAMDLKHVALSLYKGSTAIADRFLQEAEKRIIEIERVNKNEYLKKRIVQLKVVNLSERKDKYEDYLMFSTIFQNFVVAGLRFDK